MGEAKLNLVQRIFIGYNCKIKGKSSELLCRVIGYRLKIVAQIYPRGVKEAFGRGITEVGFGEDTG